MSLIITRDIAKEVLDDIYGNVRPAPANAKGYHYKTTDKRFAVIGSRGDADWQFTFNHTENVDFFVCVAYTPAMFPRVHHIWIIPCADVKNLTKISVWQKTLLKLEKYEVDSIRSLQSNPTPHGIYRSITIHQKTKTLLSTAKLRESMTFDEIINHLLIIYEKERALPPLPSPAVQEEHVQNILSKFKRPGRR